MTFVQFILLLHILGAGVLIGVVFFSLALTIRQPLTPEKLKMLAFIGSFGKWAAGWQLLTGLGLLYYNWSDVKSLTILWVKLGLFVLVGLISTQVIKTKVQVALRDNDQTAAASLPLWAWVMVLIVVAMVTIGFSLVENH